MSARTSNNPGQGHTTRGAPANDELTSKPDYPMGPIMLASDFTSDTATLKSLIAPPVRASPDLRIRCRNNHDGLRGLTSGRGRAFTQGTAS